MAQAPLSPDVAAEALAAMEKYGTVTEAAKALGIPRATLQSRIDRAAVYGLGLEKPEPPKPVSAVADPVALIRGLLKRSSGSLASLSTSSGLTQGQVLDAIHALSSGGANVRQFGELWSLEKTPEVAQDDAQAYLSRSDGTYCFGFMGDTHLGSKYARLDVLNDLYAKFKTRRVDRVFHAGNWIDGEARFNKYDLLVHGMDRQVQYLAEHYPQNGLTTYAVAGDDHEGWYCQREGVDIGRYAERAMRDAGRTDWVNLGYMEAYIPLRHAQSGAVSRLHLIHPGGGSAYATSYTVQKIVEAYEGGEKPAVLLAGHYHKLEFLNVRNVWVVQTGCTQDQTPFARKKKLHFSIGGGVMTLHQDAESGAITGAAVEFFQYFNRGFYENNRWSHSGDVVLPDRGATA
jgi:predicted phosphodiesterase